MIAADSSLPGAASLLTPKEVECLRLVLQNWSSKEIARRLGISPTSVNTHIRRARAKLGLRDRYAAAQLVEQWDRAAMAETGAPPVAPQAAPQPRTDMVALLHGLAPPLAGLGARGRLAMILALSVLMALVFGMLLNIIRIV